jgi:enamine deaminase RidA (YjgF/YER057c/UK114 family)
MPLFPDTPYDYSATGGGLVFTAGACPLDVNGEVVAPGNVEAQTEQAVDNLLAALDEAGTTPQSLLKTTVYVASADRADLVRAWNVVSARLGRVPSTLLGVSALGWPSQLVEIEAIAIAAREE